MVHTIGGWGGIMVKGILDSSLPGFLPFFQPWAYDVGSAELLGLWLGCCVNLISLCGCASVSVVLRDCSVRWVSSVPLLFSLFGLFHFRLSWKPYLCLSFILIILGVSIFPGEFSPPSNAFIDCVIPGMLLLSVPESNSFTLSCLCVSKNRRHSFPFKSGEHILWDLAGNCVRDASLCRRCGKTSIVQCCWFDPANNVYYLVKNHLDPKSYPCFEGFPFSRKMSLSTRFLFHHESCNLCLQWILSQGCMCPFALFYLSYMNVLIWHFESKLLLFLFDVYMLLVKASLFICWVHQKSTIVLYCFHF